MDIISHNLIYALILTISTLGMLPVIVCLFITDILAIYRCHKFVPAQCLYIFLLNIFRNWPFYCMKTLQRGYSQIL